MLGHFAGNAEARRLFAGIWEHNIIPDPSPLPSPTRGESERIRPHPGLGERRSQEKISGEALRTIFPDLFSETKAHG